MEKEQELEWAEAQKMVISKDLVSAAKQQLQFLATVDRNHYLSYGPALDRAIYRYKSCWLPLLAKNGESQISEFPLVVPLDCEWIWHCHRLNPVRYKADCEELYGRLLDNWNVVSSVQGKSKRQTEAIWNKMYPYEPYELELSSHTLKDMAENMLRTSKCTEYDLVSAVKRQSSFFFQVSRPHMNNDVFLEEALARYKGFLHLIKRNREKSINCFCVPTYDIDLIWHSHQLHPASYSKDTVAILGKVLEHDDTDSDRSKGKKLDVGFSSTTKQWEDTYGSRYQKAGTTYRGIAPSPLTSSLCPLDTVRKKEVPPIEYHNVIQQPMEVMLEIVGVRNLPTGHKGSLFVSCRKKQPDLLFNSCRRLSIFSESGEKQVAAFECEPDGELLVELISSHSPPNPPMALMGSTVISLHDIVTPVISKHLVEKWFDLMPCSGIQSSKPVGLHIALSLSAPVVAPNVVKSGGCGGGKCGSGCGSHHTVKSGGCGGGSCGGGCGGGSCGGSGSCGGGCGGGACHNNSASDSPEYGLQQVL
ncbi:glycine-rich domain-containing protein 2-like [Malania oleifera]|uniref:glycine-rich domain-containing protein 2-like n=1 Tax=Malania oleifera TaxID=397392 RepID=UPI0025AEACF8|nr:glycine-rich domain-containing protein 2-like [Malania oleifera]